MNRYLFFSGRMLLIAGMVLMAFHAGAAPAEKFELDRFIVPDTCGGCHWEIQEQWTHSMHNLSHKDPIYNRVATFLRKGLVQAGEIEEAESCVKCHTPVGVITGFPEKLSDDLSKTPEIATQGIQCDYCHSAVDITRMYNNGLVLEPGHGEDDPGVKYGPFDDSEPEFHEAAYSRLHQSAGICGTCHNVKHVAFGTDLETTYTEWENSPYNDADPEKTITCQGCHMYQRPGIPATGSTERPENPGSATDDSVERPHIFTHYFVGANTAVPGEFGARDKQQMAEARLQNAARIFLNIEKLEKKQLDVIVENSGAGHSIPTGVGDLRQVWLEISIKDAQGNFVFQSGFLDQKNELSDAAIIFRTVLGDGKGNPVVNLAKAKQILSDNRIPAKQKKTQTIALDFVPGKNFVITARLLYRGMPQKILNLIPGDPIGPLPVVEMAVASQKI
jgi:mono/diheme cytochrome c family protein